MSQKYYFVFSGKVGNEHNEDEVKAKLAETFSMAHEKIEKIFIGKPIVVKRGLDEDVAERYRQTFAAAGAIGEIRPEVQEITCPDPRTQGAQKPPSEQPPLTQQEQPTVPSGFWRRVIAFWIDGVIIAIPGLLIGWVFYDQLIQIGQVGRLIGFVIALGYFAILNSTIGGGQTLGKRLLKIRVVDLQGVTIPLHRSTLRYLVFGVPYFSNGLTLPSQNMLLAILLGAIVFGVGGGIFYLFVFNRRNRRTLHDFAAGTLVVKADPRTAPQFQPVWRGHFVVLAVILVAFVVTGAIMVPTLLQKEPFAEMVAMQQALSQEEGIHAVSVKNGTTWSGDNTTHWYSVNIVVSDPRLDIDETADRFARLILMQSSQVDEKDLLVVNIVRGYDIGIASSWVRQGFSFSPDVWRSKLGFGRL